MSSSPIEREPSEIELAHALLPLLEILGRDMDEAYDHLLHRAGTDQHCAHYRAAVAARGVVHAWARLIKELRRYENTRWWIEPHTEPLTDKPF